MDPSSRAPRPAPLNLGTDSTVSSPEMIQSGYFDSPPFDSPPLDSPPSLQSQRMNSCSSVGSSTLGSSPSSLRKSSTWIKPSPKVNVHTTCGRHSDQLLFGGPSLAALARAMLGKKKD